VNRKAFVDDWAPKNIFETSSVEPIPKKSFGSNYSVTSRVCKKIAQNVAQSIFVAKLNALI
jgi:hypothetical protein